MTPFSDENEMMFRFEVDLTLEGIEDKRTRWFVKQMLIKSIKDIEENMKNDPYLPSYMTGTVKKLSVRTKTPNFMRPKAPKPKKPAKKKATRSL